MRKTIIGTSLAALALSLVATSGAEAASCSSRKATGTVVGGVGGAVLGNAIKGGGLGLVAGAVGGGLVGREIGKSGCRRTVYRSSRSVSRSSGSARYYAPPPAPVAPTRVYYDRYGNPVTAAAQASYAVPAGTCHFENRSYYDSRGTLRQQQVQVCAR
jgi:hypothetical protein